MAVDHPERVVVSLNTSGGAVAIDRVAAREAPLQNVFLTHARDGDYAFFAAMLDGRPLVLDARLRGVNLRIRTHANAKGD
jgi:hypothetical protein